MSWKELREMQESYDDEYYNSLDSWDEPEKSFFNRFAMKLVRWLFKRQLKKTASKFGE